MLLFLFMLLSNIIFKRYNIIYDTTEMEKIIYVKDLNLNVTIASVTLSYANPPRIMITPNRQDNAAYLL